ncbi:granzyme K-like [Trematomus bernacchii]|uniref:granzyme K-like n=1 Tax=Trematomus bernacchii TaxID=40690 RepID=UPI00146F2563|nr:granzyme K-like [Trematomus bernacchii]
MRGLYKLLLLFLLACQDQNVLGSTIINGTNATDNSMKYMVSVQEDGEHKCGGFLVSKHFVVTHGGCKFDEDGTIFVVLGTHHLSKPGFKIKEHIMSTCKPPPGIGTDIMLIEINSGKPEKLPKEIKLQDPETDVKENEKCQVAGWGPVKNDGSDHDDQLHVVDVTVISPKACKVQIPGLRANAICTGGKQTTDKGGFCKSDAGGPLVCKGKAVGIATVNEDCSFTGLPNVYIDISKYRSWINACIKAKKCL